MILYLLLFIALAFIAAYFYDNYSSSSRKNEEIIKSTSYKFPYYFVPQKAVQWFDFSWLINTFRRVSLSADILSVIDKREVQTAMGKDSGQELIVNKFNASQDEFWFDFVADTGDGFDPTTTVFYHMTRDSYTYQYENKVENHKEKITLNRGYALVIGGDLVYPAGSEMNYRDRFKGPLRFVASATGKESPILIATPGNHDWYDGLSAFFRLMCQQCKIGGYKTVQNRSYFAYSLRKNVHLLGIDNQLLGDIDIPQMDFFTKYVKDNSTENSTNHIILVIAEPYWYNYDIKDRYKRRQRMDSLEFIIRRLTNAVLNLKNNSEIIFDVVVTGDIHHYSHYEIGQNSESDNKDIKHLITSGGGGAFGHVTDFLKDKIKIPMLKKASDKGVDYELKKVYPSKEKSRKKVFWNLIFFILNYKFTALMLFFSLAITYIYNYNEDFILRLIMLLFFPVLLNLIVKQVANPECSEKEKWINRISQFILFSVSLASQIFIFYIIPKYGIINLNDIQISSNIAFLKSWFIIPNKAEYFIFQWAVSGIFQSLIFGLYIFLCYKFFKLHITEVSSGKVNKDDKNFLKFKVTDTEIVIYVIGIEKSYKWMSVLKKKKASELQNDMINKDPKEFLKENFDINADENVKIIDKIVIKM